MRCYIKPIPHPLKNNRSAHLNYISHLKESVETVRDIVEEARVVKPLDSSLNYACRYTKLSQELLECVIGTCPKSFNERDNKAPSTPVTRKKQVTFSDAPGTSSSNTQKHEVHQKVQQTNIPVIPSTGVNDSTEASGSKPRQWQEKNRIVGGTDILKGSRSTNLYTISIDEMMKSSPICLLSKASKSKSWLWHRRLNHLNFGTINDLARKDLVRGLPRLKFEKDHLCSACQLGKSKKFSHRPKSENTNMEVLHTLHMDLCGPMRVQSIKGKKYILVIVDDYSRFTWVKFLRSKDETPEFVINFLKQIQLGLNKTVRFIRTDNGTEFVNQVMSEYYEGVGIFHQKSVPRTPQQNGVVERRNRTLVEAARTMMIFSKAPMFLWAEAVATACYTQNRSLIHTRHNKTPYELVHEKKPDLTFFRVFGALCYPTNDSEDLGKFQAKADIGIFIGYAPSRKGYRIYNKRTRLAPTDKELEMLFQPMFDEHLEQSRVNEPVPSATEINAPKLFTRYHPLSTTITQNAPSTSASIVNIRYSSPVQHQEIAGRTHLTKTPPNQITMFLHPSHNLVTGDPGSAQSSSGNVNSAEPNQVITYRSLRNGTKDHPLDNIVGNPSRPVSTRKQLASDALWCCFHTELSKVKPKNFKMAVIEDLLVSSHARWNISQF
ncbi:retrovirus-related pol polyprotein from transposon TNT 1-94 [Tanacetum coccineum]